jgi:hypothetical protein
MFNTSFVHSPLPMIAHVLIGFFFAVLQDDDGRARFKEAGEGSTPRSREEGR